MNCTAKKPTIRETVDEITHDCDGPVTRFVIICRASEQVARGVHPETVSEALYMALVEFGYMSPDPDPYGDEPMHNAPELCAEDEPTQVRTMPVLDLLEVVTEVFDRHMS